MHFFLIIPTFALAFIVVSDPLAPLSKIPEHLHLPAGFRRYAKLPVRMQYPASELCYTRRGPRAPLQEPRTFYVSHSVQCTSYSTTTVMRNLFAAARVTSTLTITETPTAIAALANPTATIFVTTTFIRVATVIATTSVTRVVMHDAEIDVPAAGRLNNFQVSQPGAMCGGTNAFTPLGRGVVADGEDIDVGAYGDGDYGPEYSVDGEGDEGHSIDGYGMDNYHEHKNHEHNHHKSSYHNNYHGKNDYEEYRGGYYDHSPWDSDRHPKYGGIGYDQDYTCHRFFEACERTSVINFAQAPLTVIERSTEVGIMAPQKARETTTVTMVAIDTRTITSISTEIRAITAVLRVATTTLSADCTHTSISNTEDGDRLPNLVSRRYDNDDSSISLNTDDYCGEAFIGSKSSVHDESLSLVPTFCIILYLTGNCPA